MESADLEARWMIEAHAGCNWAALVAGQGVADAEQLKAIEDTLERRLAGEPLSRIFGEREFWGLRFKLSPDTLDPRPDTETLLDAVLEYYNDRPPPQTILDLGTGTGCILIALLSEFPEAKGVGVDLSAGAVQTAQGNAQINGVKTRATFLQGSWFEPVQEKRFDLIVSNPPYIANPVIKTLSKEVQNHDPILALDGGEDGLQAYKNIFLELCSHLNPGGKAFFEIGYDQQEQMMRLSKESRIRIERCIADLAGNPRVVEMSCGDK